MKNRKSRMYWKDEDWDCLSKIHYWHRIIMGFPLSDSIVKFYLLIVAVALFGAIFFNN